MLVCISGSTLSIESIRDPVPSILLFCHFLNCCPFLQGQDFIATTASLKLPEMETEKSIRARKPVFELLTSHYLKRSQLATSSYKEGWKFASECVSHLPCLKFTKMNKRIMQSGHCLSHIKRIPKDQPSRSHSKPSCPCSDSDLLLPPIFTWSTKVSEYQERVTYWPSQNQQVPLMDTLRQAERGSSLFELHSRTQH